MNKALGQFSFIVQVNTINLLAQLKVTAIRFSTNEMNLCDKKQC